MYRATQRLWFLLFFFIAPCSVVSAQDKIYTNKGIMIDARVKARSVFVALGGTFYMTEHFNNNGAELFQSTHPICFMGRIIHRVHISRHFVFGLEADYGGITSHTPANYSPLFQPGAKFGGRF